MNEGWTVFTERKILRYLHGELERQFSSIIGKKWIRASKSINRLNRGYPIIVGWKALKESVKLFGPDSPATILKPDLSSGIDPDDYFSSIPYGMYSCIMHKRILY